MLSTAEPLKPGGYAALMWRTFASQEEQADTSSGPACHGYIGQVQVVGL
jgi:hypothetical protein